MLDNPLEEVKIAVDYGPILLKYGKGAGWIRTPSMYP
jgi:hypothetical protein